MGRRGDDAPRLASPAPVLTGGRFGVPVGMQGARHEAPSPLRRVLSVIAVVLAWALQSVVGWLTLSSGLVAPLWAIVVLVGLWLAAALLLVRTARRQPLATPLVPLANGLLWWAAIAAGGTLLGWTP